MDVKKLQKKYGITIDEEKDAFLSSLNKRYRNNRKKLDAIEELEKRDRATLKAEQLEKIKSRAEIQENVKYLDGIRDMYYSALKTAQDEGRLPKQTEGAAPTKVEEPEAKAAEVKPEPVQQVPTQSAEERQAELAGISRANLSKVVNLVHFVQFFRDHHRQQQFRQAFEANRGDFQLESAPEFEIVAEFYNKVFTFTESDKLGKVGDKTNRSVGELEHYVNGVDQPALRNKSYRHLQHVVEGVVSSAFFRDHTADIEVHHKQHHHHAHHHHHEHGAIGSTRKGHETEKLDVPAEADQLAPHVGGSVQEKHKSPEKAHHHAEPAKTQPQEHKPDWTAVEDEEEEGAEGEYEGEEGEEQAGEAEEEKQEKKEDDGFITVASKKKEKKEEPFRGSGAGFHRGRGRGGRGGRGGFRGERKPRPEGEAGQEGEQRQGGERRGGYRGPRHDRRSPGEEGVEGGENAGEGQREGHRGGRGGYRGGRGGYRGEGRGGFRGEGRGGYRGGRGGQNRGPREGGNERPAGEEVVAKQE